MGDTRGCIGGRIVARRGVVRSTLSDEREGRVSVVILALQGGDRRVIAVMVESWSDGGVSQTKER